MTLEKTFRFLHKKNVQKPGKMFGKKTKLKFKSVKG